MLTTGWGNITEQTDVELLDILSPTTSDGSFIEQAGVLIIRTNFKKEG